VYPFSSNDLKSRPRRGHEHIPLTGQAFRGAISLGSS
jgi:hypothetical protein